MRVLLRLLRHAWPAGLIAAASCARIEFTAAGGDGAGGQGTSSSDTVSTAGGMGGETAATASTTSTGCVPSCNEDRRCGDDGCEGLCGGIDIDQPWGLRSDVSGGLVVPWPETQSVYFAGDTTHVLRVDACTGETMASFSFDTSDGTREIRGLGRYGDALLVAYNEPLVNGTPGEQDKRAVVLDARTLATIVGPKVVGSAGDANGFWLGAASPIAVVANLADAGSFAFVDAQGDSCTYAFIGFDLSRGIAADATRVVTAWRATGADVFSLVDLSSCLPGCCIESAGAPPAIIGGPWPVGFEPRMLALAGDQVFAAGFLPDSDTAACPGPTLQAGLLRANVAQPDAPTFSSFGASECIDAFTSVAVHGSEVFAVGTLGALDVDAGGQAWVARFDASFSAGDLPIVETVISGGELGWFNGTDDGGVYVSGRAAGRGGFLVKCNHVLTCGEVPLASD